MHEQEEKRKQRISMGTSLGFHALLFILFLFLLAWTEPDPPIPEYGIELGFIQGTSNSETPAASEQQSDEQEEAAESPEEIVEPVEEVEPTPEPETVEESAAAENENTPTEEVAEDSQEEAVEPIEQSEPIETEDVNSPDVVEEVVEEAAAVDEAEKANEGGGSEGETTAEDQGESEPTPTVDSRAIYTGSKGDDSSKSSNSGGASLNLSGWVWDFEPDPNDKSSENGKIVFKIIVDDEGEIIGVSTLEKTISPAVEKIYKEAVMDLTFSKTAENRSVAATSTGTITFIIQSR